MDAWMTSSFTTFRHHKETDIIHVVVGLYWDVVGISMVHPSAPCVPLFCSVPGDLSLYGPTAL